MVSAPTTSRIRTISKSQILKISLASLVIAFLSFLFLDQQLIQSVTTKKYTSWYRVIRFLTDFGDGQYYFAAVIALGLVSWLLLRARPTLRHPHKEIFQRLSSWSLYAFSCMISSGVVLQLLKHLIGRQRPHLSTDVNPYVFDFLTMKWHYHSMPSGHSQTLFTFTTILWLTFPRLSKWIFLIPALFAFTRVPLEEHFLSDVIFGSYLGFIMTLIVSSLFHRVSIK